MTRDGFRPAALANPGDQVICDGQFNEVVAVHTYLPGEHVTSPIKNDCVARVVITSRGQRWFGHASNESYVGAEILAFAPLGIRFQSDGTVLVCQPS